MRIFQKKNNKSKTIENSIQKNVSIDNVLATKQDNTIVNKKEESKKRNTKKNKKSVCRVIVATPSYFVIKKDNETITVKEKNNYYKGQDIYY